MTEPSLEKRVDDLEKFADQVRGALRLSASVAGILGALIVAVIVRALGG